MGQSRILNLPAKPRSRRTQAERTAETRARILEATVESLDQVGFQRTTAAEITRRAGVTWGAVQHHFESKDGVMRAVLEASFDRFAGGLVDTFERLGPAAPLGERIGAFIDSAWAHFASPDYRATFEILLEDSASRRAAPEQDDRSWQDEIFEGWTRVWCELFPDVALERRRALMLQHYTISTLSGLASMEVLAGHVTPFLPEELQLLKRTLATEFEAKTREKGSKRKSFRD